MHGKTVALITGGNKGIGFAAAEQLGALGLHVLIGARDAGRGAEAVKALCDKGYSARAVSIDVTDTSAIAAAVADVTAAEGRLDVLVNNAGKDLFRAPPSTVDLDALRSTFETNVYGAIATAQAFLPLLRASPAGRIVNVSSSMGSLFYLANPQWIGFTQLATTYSMSKTALNAFTALLSAELHGTSVKVNSVEPGYTATDMTAGQGFQSPEDAARVVVKYATVGNDGPTGGFFDLHAPLAW